MIKIIAIPFSDKKIIKQILNKPVSWKFLSRSIQIKFAIVPVMVPLHVGNLDKRAMLKLPESDIYFLNN